MLEHEMRRGVPAPSTIIFESIGPDFGGDADDVIALARG
jgi:hypothetical protein